MKTRAQVQRFEQRFLTACFLVMLCLPALAMLFRIQSAPLKENRTLASFPRRSLQPHDIINFPRGFGHFFNDRFGFRESLIRGQAKVRVNWLRTSSSPQVTMGKNGWLFYTAEGLLDYYSRSKPFTEQELARWLSLFESRHNWLKQRGIPLVITVVPEAHTIYPEFMPDEVLRVGSESKLDQLIKYCQAHSEIRILDLRPSLLAEKSRHRIYHRTNSHWNDLGAFVGYQEIIRRMRETQPALNSLPETAFNTVVEYKPAGDFLGLLGMSGILIEEKIDLVPRLPSKAHSGGREVTEQLADENTQLVTENNEDGNLPRLVMFRDSFASALIPFLAEHFSYAVYRWQRKMDRDLVGAEHPDVVLLEMSERVLMADPPKE